MNWKLILALSGFGLAMAFATISLIPSKVEPLFWLVIFVLCAYLIARNCNNKYFLHGFLVSLVNSVWITAAHILNYNAYIANHPEMTSMNTAMPDQPRLMMLIMGPLFGAASGLVLGLFSFIASKIVNKNAISN